MNEGSHREITETPREIEEHYKAIVENIADAILINVGTKRVFVNKAFLELHGLDDMSQALGMPLEQFVVPEDRQLVCERTLARQRGEPVPGVYEYRIRRVDGEVRTVQTSAVAIIYKGQPAVLAVLRDVTTRRKAEQQVFHYQEQLRAITLELSLAEERERRRISNGLHDDIGNTLAMVKVKLGALQESDSSGGSARLIEEIRELIDHTIQTTRSLTFELSSPVLYTLGLEPALQHLGDRLEREHGIRCHFETDKQPKPLPEETSVILHRTVRELIRNIEKHAQARQVKMAVGRDRDQIHISVEDDGVGFDASGVGQRFNSTGGFGLFSIHEQLKHIGGRLEVESVPGHGTRVVVVAPLQ